ncbi:MAG: CPBP family intramembrane metalloprotease [Gemmatimonadota bacterium]|nr:CPBP family intramembrane metalloprotease [Gemmatimonadota bacterium]
MKDLIPVAGITSAILVGRASHLSFRDDVGLRAPTFGDAALWIFLLAGWMLGSNYFLSWRGPWDFTTWRNASLLVAALRVIGVCILAPISEEMIFRGLFYRYFSRTKLGVPLTIIVLAAGWTVLHNLYLPNPISVVFIAGLLLGAARWRTKSVYIPIAMHMVFNLYAIW